MAHCDQDDILGQIDKDQLVQLTDDDNTGRVDDDNLNKAIARSDAEINTRLRKRYTVPLSTVPNEIRDAAVDLVIYHLYSRRIDVPETRKDRYKSAIKFLDQLGSGEIELEIDQASADQAVIVTTSKDDRIFTKDTMKGF